MKKPLSFREIRLMQKPSLKEYLKYLVWMLPMLLLPSLAGCSGTASGSNESLNDPNLAEAERYSGEAAGRLQASTWQSRLSPVIVPLAVASVSWSLYVIMTTPDPMLADKERSRIFRVLAAVALFYLIPSLIRTVSGM